MLRMQLQMHSVLPFPPKTRMNFGEYHIILWFMSTLKGSPELNSCSECEGKQILLAILVATSLFDLSILLVGMFEHADMYYACHTSIFVHIW